MLSEALRVHRIPVVQHFAPEISDIVTFKLGLSAANSSIGAIALAAQVVKPLQDALKLEGSAALGQGVCNSDYPTNPSCNYPKFPDYSLPFGPSPPPDPLPAKDCVCGSPWITSYALPIAAGVDMLDGAFSLAGSDAFHDVSDTHPFHLPHIWNKCTAGGGSCVLNTTTLTMPFLKAGGLFPDPSAAPLSALEMRAKIKSRQTLWEAAGLTPPAGIDKNVTVCRATNQAAYDWALAHADPAVRTAFLAHGTPMVMVDDVAAPIGLEGPTWIKKELVFRRVADAASNTSRIEVQSWSFVVAPSKIPLVPDGMHYCKLLSPARAMEWIYADAAASLPKFHSKAA